MELDLGPFDLDSGYQLHLNRLQISLRQSDLLLVIPDTKDGVFRTLTWCGFRGRDLSSVKFSADSRLIRHFSSHPTPTSYRQLERVPWFKLLMAPEREALDRLKDALFVPLSTQGRLVGLLALGHRKGDLTGWVVRPSAITFFSPNPPKV